MCPKDTAARAKELVEEAKRGVALMVFKEVIVPHLKEWKMTLRWRMGSVFAADQYGGDIKDGDPRIDLLDELMEEVLDGIDLTENGYHNLLWWILSEQNGEATDLKQKLTDWYSNESIPSICGKKIRFKDLKRGDYLYFVEYYGGDVKHEVVDRVVKRPQGMVEIYLLNGDYESVTLEGTRLRSDDMFTSESAASKSLDRLFHPMEACLYFYFKPTPVEIMAKLLA